MSVEQGQDFWVLPLCVDAVGRAFLRDVRELWVALYALGVTFGWRSFCCSCRIPAGGLPAGEAGRRPMGQVVSKLCAGKE